MGRWFGPAGNCGCCYVPCECGPCTPDDPGYFRNVSIQVSELPSEIFWRLDSTLNPCAGYPCQGGSPLFNLLQRKIVGMDQFNGTYPATYYEYDAETDEYYESDPRNGCGYWGYTTATKTLTLQITRQEEYDNVGCVSVDLYGEVDFDVTFDPTLGGIIPPSYPIPKPASWPFQLNPGTLDQPLLPDLPQSPFIPTEASRWYAECSIFSDTLGATGTIQNNDPIVRFSSGGVTRIGAAAAPTSTIEHDLSVGVLGGFSGLPSSNFPSGVTITNGDVCDLQKIETVFEYEPHTLRVTNTIGDCDRTYGDYSTSGWSIRRKLMFDGRRSVP